MVARVGGGSAAPSMGRLEGGIWARCPVWSLCKLQPFQGLGVPFPNRRSTPLRKTGRFRKGRDFSPKFPGRMRKGEFTGPWSPRESAREAPANRPRGIPHRGIPAILFCPRGASRWRVRGESVRGRAVTVGLSPSQLAGGGMPRMPPLHASSEERQAPRNGVHSFRVVRHIDEGVAQSVEQRTFNP